MSLLDELKEKRQDAIENFETQGADIEVTREQLADQQRVRAFWAAQIVDLDKAISALTPEGKEALLESQPEPVHTEVRKQDEQDAADPFDSPDGRTNFDPAEEAKARGDDPAAPPPPQEAPAIPEGFIPWSGGEYLPVARGTPLVVLYRNGSEVDCTAGDEMSEFWHRSTTLVDHSPDHDIIAYRVIETGETQSELDSSQIEGGDRVEPLHDRPKLTNEEWDKLEKVAAVDGVDQTEVVDQTNALISEENDAPTGSGAPVSSTNIAADESVPVLDATDIAEVLQKNVPGDALLATYADGKLYATFGGSTYLVIDAPEKADGFKETPERDAYAPIHNEDEPVIHPDAAFWAKALPAEAEAKAEAKKFGGIFGFGAYESRSRR